MTAAETETNVETIEAIDFEYAPKCDSLTGTDCPNPAAWHAINPCCGGGITLCNPHYQLAIAVISRWQADEGCVLCAVCGAQINVLDIKWVKVK